MQDPSVGYPLEQVIEVKERRVTLQRQAVAARQKELLAEEEKLLAAEKAFKKIREQVDEKMAELRQLMDKGDYSPKFQRMIDHIKQIKEKRMVEEKKVAEQQKVRDKAHKALEEAQLLLKERYKELEKLKTHREEWLKERLMEMLEQDTREQDELGTMIFFNQLQVARRYGFPTPSNKFPAA